MKNNSLGTKVLMIAVTLALVAYFGIQAVRYFSDPLTTTLAYNYRVEETLSLSGFVVRDEVVLPEDSSGLLQIQREEGERVSDGGTVATVYSDQASLDRQKEIESLNARIEQLQYAREAAVGTEVAQKLDEQIRQSLLDYRAAVTAGRYRDAEKQGNDLRNQVLKRDYSGADTEDLDAQIAELQAEVKALRSQSAGSTRRISATEAGLYSAVVDGYETVLTPESLETLTPSALSGIKASNETTSNVGKLVLGKEWYYAAVVSADMAESLKKMEQQGDSLLLRFAKGVERDLSVSIHSIGEEENGRVVIVFAGDTYLSQLTLLREQSAQIIYGTVEGIRIPKEALRVVTKTQTDEDGTENETQVTGVYCVVGLEAGFKPVEILYTADHFVLVEPNPAADREGQRLRPGEEIIITARDLYDGKVVR